METVKSEHALRLRVFGNGTQDHLVDAQFLARVLQGLQRAAYVLAMQRGRRDLREQGRYPDDIARRFGLRCGVPEAGSFALPLTLGGGQADVEDADAIPETLDRLVEGLAAVSDDSADRLSALLPERRYRLRFLEAMRGIAPGAGSPHKVALGRPGGREAVLTGSASAAIRDMARQSGRETSFQTVTGLLQRIHFEEHKVFILYPVTQKLLDCSYDPDIEEMLLEQRRDWVQVTGTVVLNENDEPRQIVDVVDIRYLDTDPVEIREVPLDDRLLRFEPPLVLKPELTGSNQLMFVEHADYGINAHAQTRDELIEEIFEQVRVLWTEYAEEDDANLTGAALALKKRLRSGVAEYSDVA